MKIEGRDLYQFANAYIKDNKLEKWRWYSDDPNNIKHRLEMKRRNGTELSQSDMEYILEMNRVVIEKENVVEFIGFTGYAQKFE